MNALVILLSSLLFLMTLALFVWTRKQMQQFQQTIESASSNQKVYSELTALNAGSIGLGERFIRLEKDMQELSGLVEEIQSQMQTNSPYAYAIELAQKGYSKENISELCHISLTEAQLLVMMHQQNRAA